MSGAIEYAGRGKSKAGIGLWSCESRGHVPMHRSKGLSMSPSVFSAEMIEYLIRHGTAGETGHTLWELMLSPTVMGGEELRV